MAWTTLHLRDESLSQELLGIPKDVTQAVLLPMAYFTGETFKQAPRVPLEEIVALESVGSTDAVSASVQSPVYPRIRLLAEGFPPQQTDA